MPQEFESFAPDERLTDEEVQAIVKRYGERETASGSGPTVADVAETLQVDPSTVAQMLRDIRQSQSERQLQERLNHLEMENDDLRKRASESYVGDMFSQSHWMFRTVRRRGRRGGCGGRDHRRRLCGLGRFGTLFRVRAHPPDRGSGAGRAVRAFDQAGKVGMGP